MPWLNEGVYKMGVFSEMGQNFDENDQSVLPIAIEANPIEEVDAVDDSLLCATTSDSKAFNPLEGKTDTSQNHEASPVLLSPAQKKQTHDEQEAMRKEEWETAQKVKQENEQTEWGKILAAGDDELLAASTKRITAEVERLTRRNMKDYVGLHIKERCASDLEFSKKVLHPRKNMVNCFRYINRLALAFIKKEMADSGDGNIRDGFGGDVPEDICYQWAEEYFCDIDAPEDFAKDEKFIPKPYFGPKVPGKTSKKASTPKATSTKAPSLFNNNGQMMFWEDIAG